MQGDMGICDRQVYYRPDLVVLPVLDSGLLAVDLPPEPVGEPRTGDAGVQHFDYREHWRRIGFLSIAPERKDIECGAQDDDADLRARSEEHTSELQSLRHLVCR